jgi:hypothetical protein
LHSPRLSASTTTKMPCRCAIGATSVRASTYCSNPRAPDQPSGIIRAMAEPKTIVRSPMDAARRKAVSV